MKIPIKYNFRSLLNRRVGTAMTMLGIGLTVAIVVVMLAMIHGLDATFIDSGDELNLIVIRQGSQNETNSYFNRDLYEAVRFLPGVARDGSNEPLVAGEIITVINQSRLTGETSNVTIRGTDQMGFRLRPELSIVQGRMFQPGLRELLVSQTLSNRFQNMQLGDTMYIDERAWSVVGIFEAGGTAVESEILAPYEDVSQEWNRPIYSSLLVRAESLEVIPVLQDRVSDDQRIQLQAVSQKKYFEDQTVASTGLKALAVFIALIIGIGSCFAIMNMMYATVMARRQEIATMRAIGFRRRNILGSFVVEAAILALLGGLLGCLLASSFHGFSAGTANWATFSEVVYKFRVTPQIMMQGLLFALIVGVIGGFLPARRAARMRLIDILRG